MFIVFEAIDGSGTSTQARLLYEYLFNQGYRVFLTEEPTSGPIGNLIRLALKGRFKMTGDKRLDDRQLAFLFAADRHDHLYNEVDGIMRKIEEGWIVICTRYILSSLVYNCNDEKELEFVRHLNSEFPLPDLTLFIDCPLEICLERLNKGRPVQDIYENYDKLKRVRESYDRLLSKYEAPLHYVNGKADKLKQHEEIRKIVEEMLQKYEIWCQN
ncbi:dTMP kinase [Anoxybacter fermentans]|uniref:Thymidylate kinase n=2 Tax=Anoxybacter fermentans TaxID=1323375 RepID=A0A3Q9HSZ4_9FIRM|nr:dTMP kinase [Anoxybacter fermentans]